MLLFTGKTQGWVDVVPGGMAGFAFVDKVCSMWVFIQLDRMINSLKTIDRTPTAVVTLPLEGATFQPGFTRLLAHEMTHLLGAVHDGW